MNAKVSEGGKTWWEGSGGFGRVLELRQMGRFLRLGIPPREAPKRPPASFPSLNIPHYSVSAIMSFPRALLKCKCLIKKKTVNVIIAHYHISPN